jgi:hypothetical protein
MKDVNVTHVTATRKMETKFLLEQYSGNIGADEDRNNEI